jgi:hypothetical protein
VPLSGDRTHAPSAIAQRQETNWLAAGAAPNTNLRPQYQSVEVRMKIEPTADSIAGFAMWTILSRAYVSGVADST